MNSASAFLSLEDLATVILIYSNDVMYVHSTSVSSLLSGSEALEGASGTKNVLAGVSVSNFRLEF